ncbi:MAG: tRNA threonylcarbamoyladenosine dehydratase, partial [Ruminococcaceae bacterium]|nr:tRNA threonylcarbamoyladenosine dehydratase [Oscillospiraceae bacterium]
MDRKFSRLASVYGEKAISFLAEKHVMIFGLGGVGGYAAEAIARSGVGKITVVDFDMVNETNINRQLCA